MSRQVIVGFVVMATAGAAFAASLERPRPRRDRAAIRQELGLTGDQESQLRRLRREARTSGVQRRADLRHARLGLREALEAARVDEGAVQVRTQELADARSAQLRARVEARLALRKILTPEQLEKLKTRRSERKPGPLTPPDER
jgi:Spy/CpxP family protein refolding chaperone